jgi:hypothetical protein
LRVFQKKAISTFVSLFTGFIIQKKNQFQYPGIAKSLQAFPCRYRGQIKKTWLLHHVFHVF